MELGGDLASEMLVLPQDGKHSSYGPNGDSYGIQWEATCNTANLKGFHLPIIGDGLNDLGLASSMLMFPTFARSQTFDASKVDRTICAEQVLTWALTQRTIVIDQSNLKIYVTTLRQ